MRYSDDVLKVAGVILDRWIIREQYDESECEIELQKLGISFFDANTMMNLVNHQSVKNSYDDIKETFLQPEKETDYFDPWNDYILDNSGFI